MSDLLAIANPYVVNDHTIEFGPTFPPDSRARAAWHAIVPAFLRDRFGGRGIWLAADWERTRFWPGDIEPLEEHHATYAGLTLRAARFAVVTEKFINEIVASEGFNWDAILLIDHPGSYGDLERYVFGWADSMNEATSSLRAPCDAVYPVADGVGLRYTNSERSIDELTANVRRVVMRQLGAPPKA